MDGIVSAVRNSFVPKLKADKAIWHVAHGLANSPEMSCSTKVVIDIMSALHLNRLPLFDKLYDYLSSYDSSDAKLLATLGCKTAMATIYDDPTLNERRINIELGERYYLSSIVVFIERTDGSGKSQVFVKDYTGVEKACPERFSTLEKVIAFYKEDLAENANGIYSQHVSKDLFIASTLGVALNRYGSDNFDEHDLANVKKWFGLQPDSLIDIAELQNPALQHTASGNFSENEVELLLKVIKNQFKSFDDLDLTSLGQELLLFDDKPTLQDIQRHLTNPIKTKAEEEARCYIPADMRASLTMERDLIQMAGICAVAEAALTPYELAGLNRPIYTTECIRENSDALHALRNIFGFGRRNFGKYNHYMEMLRNPTLAPGATVFDDQTEQRKYIMCVVYSCYQALP
ncbi:MAG: hypothetical protein K0R08_1713 [Solimicrobium sp.]|jgi:hypothetical protein|nr:hypothetical protein [Solimicrobium sp.]